LFYGDLAGFFARFAPHPNPLPGGERELVRRQLMVLPRSKYL
jgi:hypothetical protein